MNNKIGEIIKYQEKEDCLQGIDNRILIDKIKAEFVNGDEILNFLSEEINVTLEECFNFKNLDFGNRLIPIRSEKEIKIRKHTKAQIPYFHSHSFYEIVYVLKGCNKQQINCNRTEIILHKGEMCLLSPSEPHIMDRIQNNEVVIKIHIPVEMFEKVVPVDFTKVQGYKIYRNLPSQCEFLVLKMLDEYASANRYCETAILNYLALFIIEAEREKITNFNVIISELNEYFQSNLPTANLEHFAKLVGYNAVYLGRQIKAASHKSFRQLLIKYKMQKSKTLLSESDMSIEEIAEKVGYNNPSGFYKQFYQTNGFTPMAFRKTLK